MENSWNLEVPYWWIVKHKVKGFAEGGKIRFEREESKKTCTKHNCTSLTIEIDNSILDFGNDRRLIGIIGNLKINEVNEMEINWINRIPWQYQNFKSLYNGEVSNILPPHQSFDHTINIQAGNDPLWDTFMRSQKRVIGTQEIHQGNGRQGKNRAKQITS
jgi:hypothetical protein